MRALEMTRPPFAFIPAVGLSAKHPLVQYPQSYVDGDCLYRAYTGRRVQAQAHAQRQTHSAAESAGSPRTAAGCERAARATRLQAQRR